MKKIIYLLLIGIVSLLMVGACSSSRKMKKKCLDCPRFSLAERLHSIPTEMNEKS